MRSFLCCSLPRWILTLGGLAFAAVAVAAYPLGLDNNPDMGPRRIALLALGLGVTLLAQAGAIRKRLGIAAPSGQTPAVIREGPPRESSAAPPQPMGLRVWLPLSLMSLAIIVFYARLVTDGNLADPPATTLYYDMLADAFASGQTHLKAVPDPRLADLSNPYNSAELPHIPRCQQGQTSGCLLFDATYYDGKYYLYWGPAPAALLVPLKLAGIGTVSDSVLAFVGATSLFAFTTAFLVLAWRRFFRSLPAWLLLPPLLLAGLAYPLPWVLDGPRIYEAAILHGAAFLMAGLVVAFPILSGGAAKPARLLVVGLLWGLAFATRSVLLFPIGAFSAALAWRVWRRPGFSTVASGGRLVAMLAIPIGVSAALIAWYNFDRFSNPLEFGWRFVVGALAGQAEGTLTAFRLDNIPINLFHYAFAPASLIAEAPFLKPLLARPSIGPVTSPQPDLFYGELVTGLLYATPFLLFAAFLLWWLPCRSRTDSAEIKGKARWEAEGGSDLRAIIGFIWIGCLAGAIPLLSIYAVTARYLLDLSPMLIVLAGLGAWIAFAGAATRTSKALIGMAIVGTALASAVVSILLAFNNWLT